MQSQTRSKFKQLKAMRGRIALHSTSCETRKRARFVLRSFASAHAFSRRFSGSLRCRENSIGRYPCYPRNPWFLTPLQ
jgi:hypothetical protein